VGCRSFRIRDLKTYAESNDGQVYHYRDSRGLECDAIIEYGNGSWGAVEIKLNSANEDAAAANLLKIQNEVFSQHGGSAKFLMVLTTDPIAYRRKDGVYAIPITCLRP